MKDLIRERVLEAVVDRVFPGCVVGVVYRDGKRVVVPAGRFAYEENAPKMDADTIFDVASVTKAIPTACLALKCIDDGRLELNHLVVDCLPEHIQLGDEIVTFLPRSWGKCNKAMTIRHLLAQTLDYGDEFHLSALKDNRAREIFNTLLSRELVRAPGSTFCYTNAASILLGLVVERVYGETLDVVAAREFFEPLEMTRTMFRPLERFSRDEIVPTEIDEWRCGAAQGVVHDESSYTLGVPVGSAGLFSTIPDLLTFLEMLLRGGELGGNQYLSSDIVREMGTNQLADIGASHGLGWEVNQPQWMGDRCSSTTFGKTGFTGCSVVCDVECGVGVVLLSNFTFPKRRSDRELLNEVRRDVVDMAFQAT